MCGENTERCAQQIMQQAVAEMMHNLEFTTTSEAVLDLMTQITTSYLEKVAAKSKIKAEIGNISQYSFLFHLFFFFCFVVVKMKVHTT